MIIGPNKVLFFVATAMIYGASVYGAASFSATDPMTRIFVGEPNRLTVPPGFHEALSTRAANPECTRKLADEGVSGAQSAGPQSSDDARPCAALDEEATVAIEDARTIGAPSGKNRVFAQPASAASAVERP